MNEAFCSVEVFAVRRVSAELEVFEAFLGRLVFKTRLVSFGSFKIGFKPLSLQTKSTWLHLFIRNPV